MKTLSRFIGKFAKLIVAVLSSHDRTILKSYLSITNGAALEVFVDQALKIRLRGFMAFAEKQSEILVDPPSTWLRSPAPNTGSSKRRIASRPSPMNSSDNDRTSHGVLLSLKLKYGKGRPSLVNAPLPARLVLLIPRSPTGLDPHGPNDLVHVHDPGLCQRPLLADPADA